jgi:hypothetical protein
MDIKLPGEVNSFRILVGKHLVMQDYGLPNGDGKILLKCILRKWTVQDHVWSNFWNIRINIDCSGKTSLKGSYELPIHFMEAGVHRRHQNSPPLDTTTSHFN